MTPTQFSALMERFDRFEDRFASRLLRVELQVAAIGGGLTLIGVLFGVGIIKL